MTFEDSFLFVSLFFTMLEMKRLGKIMLGKILGPTVFTFYPPITPSI